MLDKIIIGKENGRTPKKKYRVLIQERDAENSDLCSMRSFMIFDFKGKTTIDKITKKLNKFTVK